MALFLALMGHYFIPDVGTSLLGNPQSQKISEHFIDAAKIVVSNQEEAVKIGWFFFISLLTFISVYILVYIAKIKYFCLYGKSDPSVELTGEILEDSPLDYLLFKLSLDPDKSIMLTMDDRKVYVGQVISLGEPSETSGINKDILLVPIMSGYRGKDTLKVDFTTRYADGRDGIAICMRQDSIVSATEFDFDAYAKWNLPKIVIPTS